MMRRKDQIKERGVLLLSSSDNVRGWKNTEILQHLTSIGGQTLSKTREEMVVLIFLPFI